VLNTPPANIIQGNIATFWASTLPKAKSLRRLPRKVRENPLQGGTLGRADHGSEADEENAEHLELFTEVSATHAVFSLTQRVHLTRNYYHIEGSRLTVARFRAGWLRIRRPSTTNEPG
jgi:hypothetical protein